MSDGRDRRRHHPADEHGQGVLRDQQDDPNSYYGQPYQDGGYPAQQYGDYQQYPSNGYGDGYDASAYGDGGYPRPGYAQQYPPQGHGGDGYGYRQDAYGQPGYDPNGYDPNGYDPNGYDPNGYDPNGYDPNDYDPNGYGQQQGYEQQQGYGQSGYDGYGQPGYEQPGYDPRGYGQPGYDQGYPDQGYQPGYPGEGYPGEGYPESDGYYDPRYGRQGYPDQQGYGPADDYHTGSFIEQGFDAPGGGAADPTTTSGRGTRAINVSDDLRNTGGNRRIVGAPVDVDFPPPGGSGKKTKKRRRRTPIVLLVMLLVLVAVGAGGYYGYGKAKSLFSSAPDYSGMGSGDVKVKINKGDSSTAIAATLVADHVVKSAKAFIKAATADPKSVTIEAGWYRLHEHMSAKNALGMLEAKDAKGNPTNLFVYKVTIPEGTISVDIYTLLSKQTGIPASQFIDAAKDPVALGVDKAWFTAKRDDGRTTVTANEKGFKYPAMIEGFLFPATYSFQPDETPKQMLSDMVAKFNQVTASLNFVSLAQSKLRIPPIEALIAASIAQKEATTAKDMAGVTRVLYNRVFQGMANGLLGVDSETNYFLRMTGHDSKTSDQLKASEINDKNDPYNTHTVAGFPPGAISNPGEDALKAALNPDPSKAGYAYFQTVGNNPAVVFSKTYADFCKLNTSC